MSDDMITIGQLGGAFGVHGDVRLKSFCAEPAELVNYAPFTAPDGTQFEEIVLTGQVKGGFSARVSGIMSKEQADAFKGVELQVPRDRLPALPDDEYYYTDLVGLSVFDAGGAKIGTVRAVQDHGAGDLLEVLVPGASSTVMIPFTRAAVPTVDLAAGRIIADPPAGILPEPKDAGASE